MTPEQQARQQIDQALEKCGWIIQDYKALNPSAGRGVALCDVRSRVYFEQMKGRGTRGLTPADLQNVSGETARLQILSPPQQAWFEGADTFFVGSAAPDVGADASHRGGNPCLVHVPNQSTLEWPQYSSNSMFNALGNITLNPNADLLSCTLETLTPCNGQGRHIS